MSGPASRRQPAPVPAAAGVLRSTSGAGRSAHGAAAANGEQRGHGPASGASRVADPDWTPPPTPRQPLPPAAATTSAGDAPTGTGHLAHLLKVESDARKATGVRELLHLAANETRTLTRARQVFVLHRDGRTGATAWRIGCVSSLATVDREVPLIRWIERLAGRIATADGLDQTREVVLPAYCDDGDETAAAYPFVNMLWVPLWSRDGRTTDGLLLAREMAWLQSDRRIAERLAETFGHSLALARTKHRPVRSFVGRRRKVLLALPLIVLAGFLPVPITALAPLETVPRDAHVVAMPVDAIVQKVLVAPNDAVRAQQPLVRLVDTVARNKYEVAAREVTVAEARVERANSLSFSDPKGRHELGIARAELALRIAERNYARDMLQQLDIAAAVDGIAVFSDRKDLEGKPLSTGDRLMQIARPGQVEFRIDLAVADSIVLQPGAKVTAFLDSDPLNAVSATVERIDYQPRLTEANVAAYRMIAKLDETGREPPRFGTRGTAQVQGPQGNIWLLLFRRPLAALRQWAGV